MKKLDLFGSDDYAGISYGENYTDDWCFYYGYEATKCPDHGTDSDACGEADCEKSEWAFIAKKGDKEIVRYSESELGKDAEGKGMVLLGIGKMITEGLLKF